MKINEILAKVSIGIIAFFFIRILLIYFDFDFLATITNVIDFSGFTFIVYGVVITSFVVSFFYFVRTKSVRNFKIFLVSCGCLGALCIIIFTILVVYASSMDGL